MGKIQYNGIPSHYYKEVDRCQFCYCPYKEEVDWCQICYCPSDDKKEIKNKSTNTWSLINIDNFANDNKKDEDYDEWSTRKKKHDNDKNCQNDSGAKKVKVDDGNDKGDYIVNQNKKVKGDSDEEKNDFWSEYAKGGKTNNKVFEGIDDVETNAKVEKA